MNKKIKRIRSAVIFLVISLSLVFLFLNIAPISKWVNIIRQKLFQEKAIDAIVSIGFDRKDALKDWEEKIFKGKVMYSVKLNNLNGYLDAYSDKSASGIIYWLDFNPIEKPMVSWKWKVVKFPGQENKIEEATWWIEKQDYAARFYIIFPRFPFFRIQCLEYVWDRNLPAGTIISNPEYSNLKIMVIESGEKNLGKWIFVERNIQEDFKKAFGRNPGKVGAIAIMTDADNTLSTAEAQYDQIRVGYEK